MLKTSHRPDGIFTCFARVLAGWRCRCLEWLGDPLVVHHHWQLMSQHHWICACSRSKFPIAPMGFSHILRVRLQGGGVHVYDGSVTFSSCIITDNSAYNVRDHAQKFPWPRGKIADMPKSTLIFRFGLIFGSIRDMYVPATPANFPSPRWDFHMFCACVCRAAVSLSRVVR